MEVDKISVFWISVGACADRCEGDANAYQQAQLNNSIAAMGGGM